MDYIIVDTETIPCDKEQYLGVENETERKKLLNPIDSKVAAIGLKHGAKTTILMDESEKAMLEAFWQEISAFKKLHRNFKIVGFNLKNFDLPFLVTRSFVNNVAIEPFTLKETIDLREKLSAYKYGNVRGTLKEFAAFLGFHDYEMDGSMVAEEFWAGNHAKIKTYLEHDLIVTEKIYQRAKELKITEIDRW